MPNAIRLRRQHRKSVRAVLLHARRRDLALYQGILLELGATSRKDEPIIASHLNSTALAQDERCTRVMNSVAQDADEPPFFQYSHDLRKSIARTLTVINLKQRSQLRLFYKNKKYLPLDLRPKQTRAIRRRLSPAEQSKTLEKTKKRSTHFPQRKYAVKVRL